MNNIFETHFQALEEIRLLHTTRLKDLNNIDALVTDLYHMIECLNLDAVQLMRVTKKLKEVLKQRREIKEDVTFCQIVLNPTTKITFAEMQKRKMARLDSHKKEAAEKFKKLF